MMEQIRFVDIRGFMLYVGLGRNAALKLATEIGCKRRFGRRVVYDLRIADRYFDAPREGAMNNE